MAGCHLELVERLPSHKKISTFISKAHTNEQGKYRCHNVAIGIYQIQISKQGFQIITMQKEIVDNGNTEMNVELVPEV